MSFHWSGLANNLGIVIFAVTSTMWYILICLAGLFAIFVVGSLAWQIWDFGVRRRRSGQSPKEFLRANEQLAAEQLSKAVEEWRVPLELTLPAPRPIRSGRFGKRLRGSIPFILLLMFLGLITWQTTWRLWPSTVVGVFFLLIAYLTHRKEYRLLKWGSPARAVVTSVSIGNSSGGGSWNLQYHDASGTLIKGSVSRGSPPKNPVLTVLYDPAKPTKFIPYPVVRYEIAGTGDSSSS
jgi:hypothetical protein